MQGLQTFTKLRGRHLVLIIVVSKSMPKFPNLKYTLEDAEIYKKFLIEILGVDEKDIIILVDENATVDEIDYHI